MMNASNLFTIISFLTLSAVTYSHSNHHDHHHDSSHWIKFLPGVELFLKNRTTDVATFETDNTLRSKETYTTEALIDSSANANGTSNSSVTPILRSDYYYESNRNKVIFIPIGSIVFLILLCCCCCKLCCRSKETTGVVIQQPIPPHPSQQITIQHIHAGQPPAPPPQYQPVYNVAPPPQQHWQQQEQHQWSPHQPNNQHMEQYPPQYNNDPYNPSAPPSYGKF